MELLTSITEEENSEKFFYQRGVSLDIPLSVLKGLHKSLIQSIRKEKY